MLSHGKIFLFAGVLICFFRCSSFGAILPISLDCTRSAHTIQVTDAGGRGFGCPEYFTNKACCVDEEIVSIEDKLEEILRFVYQTLEEQSRPQDFSQVLPPEDDHPCAAYFAHLFSSRSSNYLQARAVVEQGVEILRGAAMHILCAACFVCSMPGKIAQIDEHMKKALRSVQDRMGTIFQEQLVADLPPSPECSLNYVTSLTDGVPFPHWGRFNAEMIVDVSLNVTFAKWMDRILAMLLELPGVLLFQQSLLSLVFFYSQRPDSDAFALLHGSFDDRQHNMEVGEDSVCFDSGTIPFWPELCPHGERRLLIIVPKDVGVVEFKHAIKTFANVLPSWGIKWIVSAPVHVSAFAENGHINQLVWRRFQVGNLDHISSALCLENATWVGNMSEVVDVEETAQVLQRLGEAPQVTDLHRSSFPRGIRPANALVSPLPWPSDALSSYFDAHKRFASALREGQEFKEHRVLIYTCSYTALCGGHGDRLNGMLSAMVIALLSGRFFFIDSMRPVPLALVLVPRTLDWRLYGTIAALPAAYNWNDDLSGFERDPFSVLDNQAAVIRFGSNQLLTPSVLRSVPQRAATLGLFPNPKLHAHLFHTLFKPSAALKQRLERRNLPEGRLIGIHFRAGDQMPQHWKDPPRHSLEEVDEFLACAGELEASLGWEAHFVLFADTDRVLQSSRVKALRDEGKLIWPSSDGLVHLDRSPAPLSVRGLLSVWADWWTLAFDVHALVICHSGFGATALEIGPNRPAFLGKGCVPAEGSTA